MVFQTVSWLVGWSVSQPLLLKGKGITLTCSNRIICSYPGGDGLQRPRGGPHSGRVRGHKGLLGEYCPQPIR